MLKNKFIYFASSLALSTLILSHPFDVIAGGGKTDMSQAEEFIPQNWPRQEWSKFNLSLLDQASPERLSVLRSILSKTKLYTSDGQIIDYFDVTPKNVNPSDFIRRLNRLFITAENFDTDSLQVFESEYSRLLDNRYWNFNNVLQAVMVFSENSPEHLETIVSFLLKANQRNFRIEESTHNEPIQSVIDLRDVMSQLCYIGTEPLKQITQNYEKLFPKTWGIKYCARILNTFKYRTVEDVEFRVDLLPTGRTRETFHPSKPSTPYLETPEFNKHQLTEFMYTLNTLQQVPSKSVGYHDVLFKEGWDFLTGGKLIERVNKFAPEDRKTLLAYLHSHSLDWDTTLDTVWEWAKKPKMSAETTKTNDSMMDTLDDSEFEKLLNENE